MRVCVVMSSIDILVYKNNYYNFCFIMRCTTFSVFPVSRDKNLVWKNGEVWGGVGIEGRSSGHIFILRKENRSHISCYIRSTTC